jgi:hypothetical protein
VSNQPTTMNHLLSTSTQAGYRHKCALSIGNRNCLLHGLYYAELEIPGILEPTRDNLGLMFFCVHLKGYRVSLISCEETSDLRVFIVPLQHFVVNKTLHPVDCTLKYVTEDDFHAPYFEHYVNKVVNVYIEEYRN